MAAKYDPDAEAEVLSWFKQLFNVDLEPGMREMEHQLRDGQLLVRYQPSILVIIISNTAAAAAASDRLQPSITAASQSVSRLPATHVILTLTVAWEHQPFFSLLVLRYVGRRSDAAFQHRTTGDK